jgi:hypothetical protein
MRAEGLKLRLKIHFLVVTMIQSVFYTLTILRYENYRRLDGGEHGKREV